MIQAILVQNYLGESETISMANPSSGFAITSIDGISPGDASISMSDLASGDGAYYNSSRISSREVAFNFRLLNEPSCEYNRHKLARLFILKKWARVYFVCDERLTYIDGYVSSNSVNVFTNPVTARVSLLCDDPHFHSVDTYSVPFSRDIPMFQFDFAIGSPIVFSQRNASQQKNIFYDGEEENGATIKIHITGTEIVFGSNIIIYNLSSGESMTIRNSVIQSMSGSGLVSGDDVVIVTTKGNKSVTLIRNGVKTNVLTALSVGSDWISLLPGDNVFSYVCSSSVAAYVQIEVLYDVLYNGI